MAFSTDGRFLASAGADLTARIWDVAKGTLHRTLAGHQDPVMAVSYGSGGTLLATASDRVRLWDPATGKLIRVLETPWHPHNLAFTSGGLLAAAGSLWDTRTGAKLELPNAGAYPSGD